MFVIPECFYRGSSFFRHLESGFRLTACRNDSFFNFCKRLRIDHQTYIIILEDYK